jgi:hypothetical protein
VHRAFKECRLAALYQVYLLGHDHGIDHVNDTIACSDVSLDHFGVVHAHTTRCGDGDVRALNSLDLTSLHVSSHHSAGNHVVSQHSGQLGFVFEQRVQISLWDFGKSLICWSEYSEWTFALECGDQVGGGDSTTSTHKRLDGTVEVVAPLCDTAYER